MRFIQRWKRKGHVLILLLVDYPDETLRGRCRVSTAQNADSISHVSKIHSLCNEKNGEPENIPSTHGDLSKNSGQILFYPSISLSIMLISEAAGTGLDRSIKRRYTPVFAFEEKYDDSGVEVGPRPLW